VQRELREPRFGWGRVTVSAGIAFYEEGMGSYEVLLAAADRALYAAKAAGRDRIEVYRTPAPAELSQAAVPVADGEKTLGRASIMLIDDDWDVLRAVGRILRRAGYDVEETDDPERVISGYRDGKTRPDLLITDVMMPRMNGLALAETLLRLNPALRVVYLSAYLQEEAKWAELPRAVSALVGKPVELERLTAVVQEVLGRGAGADRPPPAASPIPVPKAG
jgi:PleD family two-component response regulator